MATNVDGKKISALTAASSVSASDQIIIETSAGTRRVRADALAALIASSGMRKVDFTFDSKLIRSGGKLYKQGNHVHGTLFAAASSNPTTLKVTSDMGVIGLTMASNPIYFGAIAAVPENLFNLSNATSESPAYALVGTSAVRVVASSDGVITSTAGPCVARYDGAETTIFSYKGVSNAVKSFNTSAIIDYLTD